MTSPILEAVKLSKVVTYPKKATLIDQISLTLMPKCTYAIQGPSGSGKSSLLHILGTLDIPSSGQLWINQKKVGFQNTSILRNKTLGFIFQSFHLLEDSTLLENVLMPLRIARQSVHPTSETYHHALHLIERVGLVDRMHFHVKHLSGGEKQRTAIARALVNRPQILLADEPTGNLDSETTKQIQTLLFELSEEKEMTMLIVTHNSDLAKCCDTQYNLIDGKLSNR